MNQQIPAHALAFLREVDLREAILDHLRRIEATPATYDG